MKDRVADIDKKETSLDKDKRKLERYYSDVRSIIKLPEGRRIWWKSMCESGVFRRSYNGDTLGTMFNEGRRSLGLDLLNDLLEAKPEVFSQMQQEHQSELKREENEKKEEIENDDPLSR